MVDTWSVNMTSEFPMGAGIQLRSPEPGRITFLAPWDRSPQPLWFNFRVSGTMKGRVRFDLLNADQCLGGPDAYRLRRVYPVYTTDTFELPSSRQRWHRVAPDAVSYQNGVYSFTVEVDSDTVTVAHCYPYGPLELQTLIQDLGAHSPMRGDDFCQSGMGNAVPRLRVGDDASKPIIWLTARLHAGEVGGTWALDGLLRWLLSGHPDAKWLLDHYRFHAFPLIDIDGILNGWYGKERAPLDFNRAWFSDSPRPEVSAILGELLDTHNPGALLLDFHCPCAHDPNMVFLPLRETMPESQWEFCKLFADKLAEESPENARLTNDQILTPTYMGSEEASTCAGAVQLAKGIPTLALEVSYGYQNVSGGGVMTQEAYRSYGAAIGRAMSTALRRMPDAAKEIVGQSPLSHARPTLDYSGRSFKGCFPWTPPHAARLRCQSNETGETLAVDLESANATVNLALPPLPISDKKTYRVEFTLTGTPAQVNWTFFGLSESGLWLRWTAKASTTLSPSSEPHAFSFQLAPPPSARYLQASVVISGGPARLDIAPSTWD